MTVLYSPAGNRLLGNLIPFSRDPLRYPIDITEKHGGIARFRIFNKPIIAITHPELARHVFITNVQNYRKSYHYRNSAIVSGMGLIASDGDRWLQHRRWVQPGFNRDRLRQLAAVVTEKITPILEHWEEEAKQQRTVDAVPAMQYLAMGVICKALLSDDMAESRSGRFTEAVRRSFAIVRRRNTTLIALPLWIPTLNNLRLKKTRNILDTFVGHYIRERQREGYGGEARDILDFLIQARDPETAEGMPDEALMAETKTMFLAGYETTANSLTWALYLLARHPDIAARWHDEVDRVLGGRTPQWQDVEHLSYCEQIAKETLRLYPPVYNLARESIGPDSIGGNPIEAGTTVLISIYGMHHASQWWDDPERFRPERFAPEHEHALVRGAYIPFGSGKRTCVGNHFSMIEMTLALAMIGQRFGLSPADDAEVSPRPWITLIPQTAVNLRPELRHRD